jgi:hypothetical protein
MNFPYNFSESLETGLRVKNTEILWCGSGIRNLFDPYPGFVMEKFGSGIRDDPGCSLAAWVHIFFLKVDFSVS